MSTDRLTPEQRQKNMRAVRGAGSQIERRLQIALWHKGYRYRKNYKEVTGKPDIAFPSLKIAVFCDSEFWHGCDWENRKFDFHTKQEFWWKKIEGNIQRDLEVNRQLEEQGWIVLRFWGREIKNDIEICIKKIEETISERKQFINSNK